MNKKLVRYFQGPGVYSDSNFCWVCVLWAQNFQQILDPMASVLDCYSFAWDHWDQKRKSAERHYETGPLLVWSRKEDEFDSESTLVYLTLREV